MDAPQVPEAVAVAQLSASSNQQKHRLANCSIERFARTKIK